MLEQQKIVDSDKNQKQFVSANALDVAKRKLAKIQQKYPGLVTYTFKKKKWFLHWDEAKLLECYKKYSPTFHEEIVALLQKLSIYAKQAHAEFDAGGNK